MRILIRSIWNTASVFRSAALILMLVAALSIVWAQGPTQLDPSGHSAPATLPHMYEYAFTFQAGMEKLGLEREGKGGDGSVFREILRLRFQLNESEFTMFENAAIRYDLKDKEVRARVKEVVIENRARHPNTSGMSKAAVTLIHSINAERESEAGDEINTMHSALQPTVATQLDDAVTAFYTRAQQGSKKANTAPSKFWPLVLGPSPLLPGETRPGVIADCSYTCTAATPSGSIELSADALSIAGSSTSTISSTDQENDCYPFVIGTIDPGGDSEEDSGGNGDSDVTVDTSDTVSVGNSYSETTTAYSCNALACSDGSTLITTGFTTGVPSISSISPSSVVIGTSDNITVNGSFLKPGGNLPTVTVNGSGLTLNVTGGSEQNAGPSTVTLAYTVSATATPGTDSFTLTDAWGTSNAEDITVVCGAPAGISVSPATWPAGVATKITISGTGFCNTSTVAVSGSVAVSGVSYVSSSTITATVTPAVCDPSETVTLTVTNPSTGGLGGGVSSSTATVTRLAGPTPTITLGSGTGNVAGTTQSIVVGQKVVLTSSIGATAFGCLSTQSWSAPTGTSVGGFYVTSSTTGGVTTYTEHLTSAPVIAAAASGQSDTFYWTNAGNSRAMKYQYTLTTGASGSATVTFNVSGPTGGPMTAVPGTVNVWPAGTAAGGAATTPWLEFGVAKAGNVGMQFTATATAPAGNAGSFSFVQLVGTNSWQFRTNPTTGTHTFGTGLDNTYPYGNVTATTTNDSPGIQLDAAGAPTEGEAAETFHATMYLMWTPTAAASCTGTYCAIPVPLANASWSFNGDVIKTLNPNQGANVDTWIKSCGAAGTVTVTASSSYPVWTNTIHNSE
jgi:hypothetical protein